MVLAHDISKGDRTKDVKITQNITFETMLLAPETMLGLKDSGFYKPSPIQLYGIPIGKCGFDLLLEAKSGTGKTAVFSIIALEKIDFSKGLQVVILTPTREIAAQICDVLKQIGSRYTDLQVEVVMGGLPVQDDIDKFKKPVHIVVGSPGRLKHLIQDNYIETKGVRLLVLDEADKLMEHSFQSDIKFIHVALPKQKQVIMSSATYPEHSRDLINSYVQNASHVCPDSDCILLGIDQKVSFVKYNSNIIKQTQDKFKELNRIFGRLQFKQCLVFCNYQARVAEVNKLLRREEWPSQKLHGQQEQVDRLDALKTLQQYKCRILVSTDLAARGIDACNIDLVINFEPPHDWQTYLHRIGRAGRFGSYGLAITILSEGKETQQFKGIFKTMEVSLNMRHLWSDETFNIEKSHSNTPCELCELPIDNNKEIDVNEKKPRPSIWELLNYKSYANNDAELQCQSKIKEVIPKVEAFSELMLSLKENDVKDNVDDIEFKHMEMSKISTTLNGLMSADSQNTVAKSTVIGEPNIYNKESPNHASEVNNEIQELISNGSRYNKKNVHEGKADKQSNLNNTFSNLELPKMFTNSKLKFQDSKQKINKTISAEKPHRSKISDIARTNKDLRINNKHSNVKTESSDVNNHIDKSMSFVERDLQNINRTKVFNDYETNNYNEEENICHNPKQGIYGRSHKRRHSIHNYNKHTNSGQIYRDWYNELKIRMKYIEQAIYINEMANV